MKKQEKSSYGSYFVKGSTSLQIDGDSSETQNTSQSFDTKLDSSSDVRKFYETVVGLEETEAGTLLPYKVRTVPGKCLRLPPKTESADLQCGSSTCTKKEAQWRLKKARRHTEKSTNYYSAQKRQAPAQVIKDIFNFCSTGDINGLQNILERYGSSILKSARDHFNWTPLMTAASLGYSHVVLWLLEHGASKDDTDSAGNTARIIAMKTNNVDTAILIKSFKLCKHKRLSEITHDTINSSLTDTAATKDLVHCQLCDVLYDEDSDVGKKHLTSTVHLFNLNKDRAPPTFSVPQSNIGYQLMVKNGWELGKGLGKQGQGTTDLVSTELKTDRSGIGAKKCKRKVTHFKPYDDKAIGCSLRQRLGKSMDSKPTKQSLARRERQSRQQEIRLRREMNGI